MNCYLIPNSKIMNKTSAISSNFLNLKINEQENYSFSTRGREFLCLNKRLVEIGIGTCVVASILKDFNFRVGVISLNFDLKLDYQKLTFLFDYLLPVGFGLSSLIKISNYEGLSWLLLASNLFQNRPSYLNETEFAVLFWSACSISATIGRGIMMAGYLTTSLLTSSFLINQYGWQSICQKLTHFNNWQNTAVSGILEIKDNFKYQVSLLGRDVLCLNKALLYTYFILSCFLTFSYHYENKEFALNYPILLRTSAFIAALSTAKIIFKNYSKFFTLMLTALCMTPSNAKILSQVLLSEIGSGMLYGGIGLIIFALFSYIIKKTDNKQAIKILNYLKDKKSEAEYKRDIENQRKILETRKEEINKRNNTRHNNPLTENNEPYTTATEYSKHEPRIKISKKIDKPTAKTQNKNTVKNTVIKKTPVIETNKEYIVNLTRDHLTTWNQLFEITKSKPDHLVIPASEIIKLITTLGGHITKSGKYYHMHFGNKNLAHFEITHGKGKTKDKAETLTAHYAQNIKEGIEKAIDSGYISEHFVKVKH